MPVLKYSKKQYDPKTLSLGNYSTRQREQHTVITGSVDVSEEKKVVWVSGSGVSVQSRGLVPTTEFYTAGGRTAEDCDWDPSIKGGHSVGLTVSRSSELYKFISETEKSVASFLVKNGVLKGYTEAQAAGFVKSSLREYERVLTFTTTLDPFTGVKNKDLSSTVHPLSAWNDNPMTPGYSVTGLLLYPSFFSVVGGVKGQDPVIRVHFKVSRFDVERRLTTEERLDSIMKNPEQSHWASVVNEALNFDPSEDDEEEEAIPASPVLGSPPRLTSALRAAGGIKKKHADAKRRKSAAAQFIDDEAIEDSDY
jgi:hypothetical protein